MCIDRLEHVGSILQQHTNTLRIMQGQLAFTSTTNKGQYQFVSVVSAQIKGSSHSIYIDPTRMITPPNLAAQLPMTSPKTLNPSATAFRSEANGSISPQSAKSIPTSGITGSFTQGAISGYPPASTRKSYGEVAAWTNGHISSYTFNPLSTRDKHNTRTLGKDSQHRHVTINFVRSVRMTI